MVLAGKPDLNSAAKSELLKVDQIGQVLAQRLIDNRPFKNWDAVSALSQIGPVRLTNLQAAFQIHCGDPQSGNASSQVVDGDDHWDVVSCSSSRSKPKNLGAEKLQPTLDVCINKMDLNTASKEELMQTYQIGDKLADRLIDCRPFKNWAEVGSVPYIGPVRLEHLSSRFFLKDEDGQEEQNALGGSVRNRISFPAKDEDGNYLPDTLFENLNGDLVRVYEMPGMVGHPIRGSDGQPIGIKSCVKVPACDRDIITLHADDVELRLPASGRIMVKRGVREVPAPASSLREGDDVRTKCGMRKLSCVQKTTCHVDAYRVTFDPDKEVEAFTVSRLPDNTLRTRGCSPNRNRRGGMTPKPCSLPWNTRTPTPQD